MARQVAKRAARAEPEQTSSRAQELRAQMPSLFVQEFDQEIARLRAAGYDCAACTACAFRDCKLAGAIRMRRRFAGETKVTKVDHFAWVKDTLPPKQDQPRLILDMERDGTRWGRA